MNQYEKQGFDFDPETIDLLDAILQNMIADGEIKDEFKKLKFVKQLDGTFNGEPGPLKQLIEKMATMEREFTRCQLDLRRAVSDVQDIARTMTTAACAHTTQERRDAIGRLESIQHRQQYYSWNQQENGLK